MVQCSSKLFNMVQSCSESGCKGTKNFREKQKLDKIRSNFRQNYLADLYLSKKSSNFAPQNILKTKQ